MDSWRGFTRGKWCSEIDVRGFIQHNYIPYEGDSSFLAAPTEATRRLWEKSVALIERERERGGVLDIDTDTVSTIVSHAPGYIDKKLEKIVGLQTDSPLKRAVMPSGGLRMVVKGCRAYGYEASPEIVEVFSKYRKTHNDAVYQVYTPEMRRAKKAGIITGLPDAYGRGRIIGDYRRVALYGTDLLIKHREEELLQLEKVDMDSDAIQKRMEIKEQTASLEKLREMAAGYGFDISGPADNALEAVQWLYFAYLGAVKEQNGAAMSLGRASTFIDIYFERDFREGTLNESEAQELIDHFVMKLRLIRFLRTPEYDRLFSGDPVWVTESTGGMGLDGRTLVTRTSFRFLNTLVNLGSAPEPNMTVLWAERLPEPFKRFCTRLSIKTSSIQYENDDLMRAYWGDDYGIACCVSAMRTGKQMQFFGARCNLAKALLYAINGGRDEMTGVQVGPAFAPVYRDCLDYDGVINRFESILDWVAELYMNTLNVIHYMHDRYAYETLQMALHDADVFRTMACGVAGLSVVADSLSAIKYANVRAIRNENGLVTDYETKGDYPKFGNNDDRVDSIAENVLKSFMKKLERRKTYRNSVPTLSVLTITSNVVYGKKTGNTPDGRKTGEPFAPGANPMHGRDKNGALAVLSSVAKLPYEYAQDGISYTFSIVPGALGRTGEERTDNLVSLLNGYFRRGGHHINVNVFRREVLLDAMEHPEKYPQLTIRVSGYAVNFIKLTREQQMDVINRTIHEKV